MATTALDPLAARLRDHIAKVMSADPQLIETALETALDHPCRSVCVAIGDADSVMIQFDPQRRWHGLRKPTGAGQWKIIMEMHR